MLEAGSCGDGGTPIRTIQEFLGHADARTTQIYAHYAPSEHEVELVDAAFAQEAVRDAEPPELGAGEASSGDVGDSASR